MARFLTRFSSNPSLANKRPREDPVSPDSWQTPKKFVTNTKGGPKEKEIPTNNRYSDLSVDPKDATSNNFYQATKKKAANNIPPIIIEVQNDWTHQMIRDILMKYNKDFHLQLRGRKLARVKSYSAKNHQILKEGLLKEKIPFHTFTRKDELRPKAVIKGLPKFLQGIIEAELESLGFIGVKSSELKTLKPTDCPSGVAGVFAAWCSLGLDAL